MSEKRKQYLISAILHEELSDSPFSRESMVYRRSESGLNSMNVIELDALRTLIQFGKKKTS